MNRSIHINGRDIEYLLKRSDRTRSLRITIYPGGRCVVTAPQRVNEKHIERFIRQKAQWMITKVDHFKDRPPIAKSPHGTRRDFLKNKEAARVLVRERIKRWNEFYGFPFKNISIRNQRTRWGSCSKKGNISINYKIVHIPAHLADYLIVHELCHLKEMNHSRRFWNLVARTMPDHKRLRRELKGI